MSKAFTDSPCIKLIVVVFAFMIIIALAIQSCNRRTAHALSKPPTITEPAPIPINPREFNLDQIALEIFKAKISRDGYEDSQRNIDGAYVLAEQFIEHNKKD